jgi:hypothetical protein
MSRPYEFHYDELFSELQRGAPGAPMRKHHKEIQCMKECGEIVEVERHWFLINTSI